MNARPKKCLKLEGSNITAGVVESVEQFLLHSRNPAFLQSCLQLLQASTIQDAKERLSLHTWALVHRCHGLEIPEDVVDRLAWLSLLSPDEITSLRSLRENEVQSTSQRPEDNSVNSLEVQIPPGSLLGPSRNDDASAVQLTPPLYQTPESQDVAQSTCLADNSRDDHNVAYGGLVFGETVEERSPSGGFDGHRNDPDSQGNDFPVLNLRENNLQETSRSIEDCINDQEEVNLLTPPGSLAVRNTGSPVAATILAEEQHSTTIQIDLGDHADNFESDVCERSDIEEFAENSIILLDTEDVEMELSPVTGPIATRTHIQSARETDADGCAGNKTDDESIEVSSMYEPCSSQNSCDEQFAELVENNYDMCNSDSREDGEILQDRHQSICRNTSGAIPKRRNTRMVHLQCDKLAHSMPNKTISTPNCSQNNFHSQSKRSKFSSSNYSSCSDLEQPRIPLQYETETTTSMSNPNGAGQCNKSIIKTTSIGFSCLLSQIDVATSALVAGLDRDANTMIDDAMRSLSHTIAPRDQSQGLHSSLTQSHLDEFMNSRPNQDSSRAALRPSGTCSSAVNNRDIVTSPNLQTEKKFSGGTPQENMQEDMFNGDGENKSLLESTKQSQNNGNNSKSVDDTDNTASDYSLSDVDDDVSLGTISDWGDDTTDIAVCNNFGENDDGAIGQDVTLDCSVEKDAEERSLTSFDSEPLCQDDTFSSLEQLSCACPPDDALGKQSSIFTNEYNVGGQAQCEGSTFDCASPSGSNNDGSHKRSASIRMQKFDDPSRISKPFGEGAEENESRWGWTDDDASSIQSESLLKDWNNDA